jgi:hypothetical protein
MRITFIRDAQAELVSLDGERVVIRSTEASAPGSRAAVVFADGTRLRAKIHRCRRIHECFELKGRMLDMSRAVRERIGMALTTPDPPRE